MHTPFSPPLRAARPLSPILPLTLAVTLAPGCLELTKELSPTDSGDDTTATTDPDSGGDSTTTGGGDTSTGASLGDTEPGSSGAETVGETAGPDLGGAWIATWPEVTESNYLGVGVAPNGMIFAAGWGELPNTFTRRGVLHGYTPAGERELEYFDPSLDGWRLTDACVSGGTIYAVAEQLATSGPHPLADDLRVLHLDGGGGLLSDAPYDGELAPEISDVEQPPRALCDDQGRLWVALTVTWPDNDDTTSLVLRVDDESLAWEHAIHTVGGWHDLLGFGLDPDGVVHHALDPFDGPDALTTRALWTRFAPDGSVLGQHALDEELSPGPLYGFAVGSTRAQFHGAETDAPYDTWVQAFSLDAQPLWTKPSPGDVDPTRHASIGTDGSGFIAAYAGEYPLHELALVQHASDGESQGAVTVATLDEGLGALDVSDVASLGADVQVAVGRGQLSIPEGLSAAFVARHTLAP
ncbi:MAG: hypothetical protein H6713_19910 [Myxococcales bacterium]|nr:hypothetical protein [Myxococcales bacterium]MCB9752227.1 hypothetical protein [Myxococcales bacterium]